MPSSARAQSDSLPGWLVHLLVVLALVQTAIAVARPVTAYRALDLGAGAAEVGQLSAAFAVLPVLVALPLGRLVDRRRPEPVLVLGVLLLAAGCLRLATSGTLVEIALGNVVLGLGNLGCVVGGENVVARLPSAAMDRGFGLFTAVVSAGQLVGPLLAGWILSGAGGQLAAGTARALLSSAVICVAAVPLAALLSVRRTPGRASPASAGAGMSARAVLAVPRVPSRLFTSLVLASTVDLLTAYLPVLGESRGIAPSTVGVLLSVRAAATVSSRLLVPRLLRRLSRPHLVLASTVGSGALLALVPAASADVGALAVLLGLTGLLLGVGQPLMMTMLVRSVPAGARGTTLALRLVGHRVGVATTPAAAGLVAGAAGVSGAFWFVAALLATASLGARGPQAPG